MTDHKTLHLAREWAKAIDRGEEFVSQDWIDAAATYRGDTMTEEDMQ